MFFSSNIVLKVENKLKRDPGADVINYAEMNHSDGILQVMWYVSTNYGIAKFAYYICYWFANLYDTVSTCRRSQFGHHVAWCSGYGKETRVPKVVGLNPGAIYWMDTTFFHIKRVVYQFAKDIFELEFWLLFHDFGDQIERTKSETFFYFFSSPHFPDLQDEFFCTLVIDRGDTFIDNGPLFNPLIKLKKYLA